MNTENVSVAGKSLNATNTAPKNIAPKFAPVQYVGIKAIRKLGAEPVYNMEVETYHNFSVNGGIIVHNCMDAIRYFCMTVLRREIKK